MEYVVSCDKNYVTCSYSVFMAKVTKSKLASFLASQHQTPSTPPNPSQKAKISSSKPLSKSISKPKPIDGPPTPPDRTASTKQSTTLSQHQKKLQRRLTSSQFRLLNETLYTSPSETSFEMVQSNPDLFETVRTILHPYILSLKSLLK